MMEADTYSFPPSTSRSVPGSVVDVEEALSEFNKLDSDIEARKEDVEGGSTWNIRDFFEEGVRNEEGIGHKLKRMGVIVKNLTVVGMGADAASIPTNLDILKALWPLLGKIIFIIFIFFSLL